jgi:hypothetical protein
MVDTLTEIPSELSFVWIMIAQRFKAVRKAMMRSTTRSEIRLGWVLGADEQVGSFQQ